MTSVHSKRLTARGAKHFHMSTSELRRGPGWWMDLDGQWNPPEEWPEATPPLPGWVRDADGFWTEPPELDECADPEAPPPEPTGRPIPEVTLPPEVSIPSIQSLDTPTDTDPPTSDVTHYQLLADITPPPIPNKQAPTPRQSALTFSEATATLSFDDDRRSRRRAASAALLAAVTASMVAAGLVLLLLLL